MLNQWVTTTCLAMRHFPMLHCVPLGRPEMSQSLQTAAQKLLANRDTASALAVCYYTGHGAVNSSIQPCLVTACGDLVPLAPASSPCCNQYYYFKSGVCCWWMPADGTAVAATAACQARLRCRSTHNNTTWWAMPALTAPAHRLFTTHLTQVSLLVFECVPGNPVV